MGSKHFVARISVERVERGDPPNVNRYDPPPPEPKRSVKTIANITISASDLDALKDKAAAHLAIIDDGGEIDKDRITR